MLKRIRQVILASGDVAAALLSLLFTVFFGFWNNFSFEVLSAHLFPFFILYFFWLVAFYIFDLYNLNVSRMKFLFYPRFIQALILNFILGIGFFYLWPAFGITPKTNLILNIIFFGVFALIWRRLFYRLFSKRLLTNMAILGQSEESKALLKEIEERPYLGYRVKKVYPLSAINSNFFHKIKKENRLINLSNLLILRELML